MAELKYEIKRHIADLSETPKGWKKELNVISWNENAPKYDIRDWSPNHDRMSKGITFTAAELEKLKAALENLDVKQPLQDI